jgi:hypothetical protein
MNGDTPQKRGRRAAAEVLEAIAPRLERGEGPVDLDALARRVEEEVTEAIQDAFALFVGGSP